MDPNVRFELDKVAAIMRKTLTKEQMDFASNFTVPTLCFSDPGTGKTNTLLAGIYLLQTFYGIDSSKICCVSYTKNATNEIAGRYLALCEKARISTHVHFCTFHSFTNELKSIGFPNVSPCENTIETEMDYKYVKSILEKQDIDVEGDPNIVHRIVKLVNKLNAAMKYDPDHLDDDLDFVLSGLSHEQIEAIRKEMYMRCFYSLPMPQGDIPMYALSTLIRKPEVAGKFKNKYKVMIIDEFQDMSQLNLEILRRIADVLIVVGDMKQLIYAYNGATQRSTEIFMKYYPGARTCNLTKSFRCAQPIADFARDVIAPNFPPENPYLGFEGLPIPATIDIKHTADIKWEEVAARMKMSDKEHDKTYLILYRNNMAALPLVEELYRKRVPMQTEYTPIMKQPMYSTLFDLMEAAVHPSDIRKAEKALKHFPEFRKQDMMHNPILSNMRNNNKTFFEAANVVKFRYDSSREILQRMYQSHKKYEEGNTLSYIMGPVFYVYEKFMYRNEIYKLPETLDYYKSLVAPYCNKTYDLFVAEEYDKVKFITDCCGAGMGARLCTMHSAKGLEADVVYMLHIDEGLFPNASKYKKHIERHLIHGACEMVKQERNLLYTAITRAKTELHISYDTKLSQLIESPDFNEYTQMEARDTGEVEYNDLEYFAKTYNLGVTT